jgi:fatty-acid peroxygenase
MSLLLRDGYEWGRRLRGGRTTAEARMLGRPAVVVSGPEGVRRFYDARLRRRGAVPALLRLVLFGPAAVHGLDDEPHRQRKALFTQLLSADEVVRLGVIFSRRWEAVCETEAAGDFEIFDEAVVAVGRSVFEWVGIRVDRSQATDRSRHLGRILEGFAQPGVPYARAVAARWSSQRWARRLVRSARSAPAEDTCLGAVAWFRDEHGSLLTVGAAATELLNILRPTVAAAWFITFAADALAQHPDWRARIHAGDAVATEAFCQEVRRHYPFVPALAARARHQQDVLGTSLPRGGYVVLDVFGTNHDPRCWVHPDRFDPQRFMDALVDCDAFVPQGGGDVMTGHRCPGEGIVMTLLMAATIGLADAPALLSDGSMDIDLTVLLGRPDQMRRPRATQIR